ncbi:MAG: hypothetical protein AAGA64_07040 [Bacteroidota bacterium]
MLFLVFVSTICLGQTEFDYSKPIKSKSIVDITRQNGLLGIEVVVHPAFYNSSEALQLASDIHSLYKQYFENLVVTYVMEKNLNGSIKFYHCGNRLYGLSKNDSYTINETIENSDEIANEVKRMLSSHYLKEPLVKEGTLGEASILSARRDALAIFLKGGETGLNKKVAETLAPAFANRTYTDKPMYIIIIYGAAGGDADATIYFNGKMVSVEETKNLGKMIDAICEAYVKDYGNHLVIPSDRTSNN